MKWADRRAVVEAAGRSDLDYCKAPRASEGISHGLATTAQILNGMTQSPCYYTLPASESYSARVYRSIAADGELVPDARSISAQDQARSRTPWTIQSIVWSSRHVAIPKPVLTKPKGSPVEVSRE